MSGSIFNAEQRNACERDGYVMVRKLFDDEEITILRAAIEDDPALRSSLYDRRDAAGKATRMAIWNHPGDSVYGLAARSRRVVDTMEDLLGGEVYHYHSKLTAKEPLDGGAWEWHQDYGYWYHNGFVFPHMASVMVALDRATRENGCLQVVKGSHHCGRIEHGVLPGEQVGADPQARRGDPQAPARRVCGDGARRRPVLPRQRAAPLRPEPLNAAAAGRCCTATTPRATTPIVEHHHPMYTPLQKVDDGAIKHAGVKFAHSAKEFRESSANPPELKKRID